MKSADQPRPLFTPALLDRIGCWIWAPLPRWLRVAPDYICVICVICGFFLPSLAVAQKPGALPYQDPRLPIAERAQDLLGRMTLEEKFWQLFMIPGDLDDPANDYRHGVFGLQVSVVDSTGSAGEIARAHACRINAIQRYFVERTRLGIPIIPFDEAVHGLIRPGATMFPQAIALAAAWDSALVGDVAQAIARETGSRGIRQVLSPVLNIASDVRWGRVEETYGEDPVLASRMGEAFVRAFEALGVAATPKHFVANVGEGGRDSYPIDYDRRALEERFFPPFRSALAEAGAHSVMAAYNSVGGIPASQNRWLLTHVLRGEWHFGGVVISDQAATAGPTVLQHTEASTATAAQHALEAGLDVIFQSAYPQYRPYLAAFQRGLVPRPVLDTAVARVLRLKFELGLFEHPYADPDSAARWNGNARHAELARQAARESIVLLRNRKGTLPLSRSIGSVAVIGSDAVEARLGDYSGAGARPVSILDGIRQELGSSAPVRYTPGPGRADTEYVTIPAALRGEYFANPRLEGEPRVVRSDTRVDFHWTISPPAPGIPQDWYSVRWTGQVTISPGGVRRIGVEGNDGYRLYLDDSLVIDNWRKRSYGVRLAPVAVVPGSSHRLRLEYFETRSNGRIRLVWDAGAAPIWPAALKAAVALARTSDVAIVVAGIEEGEFHDRALLALPGRQEDLIRQLAATGTPVVVVLIGGSAVTMPWLEEVDAVVDAWYPGEQGGPAVADVLFGGYNPAGRLPITFPVAEGQLPLYYNHEPAGRGDDYGDLTGLPLFPFGFGLSYTTFEYSSLGISPESMDAAGTAVIRCRVRNTGTRGGDEVVQLYIHQVLGSVARPVIQLQGFQRIHLEPGEEREVRFRLSTEQLRTFQRGGDWVVESGAYQVMVGASSRDLRLRGVLLIR